VSNELAPIGYVIKTHGVKGHLRIAFSENIKELSEQEALYFLVKGNKIPFFIKEITYFKNGDALVLLEDIVNKEEADRYTKKDVFGPETYIEDTNESDEDPWVDFMVADEQFGELGLVTGSIDMGEYWLLEINFKGKQIMIPLHDEMIVDLNEETKHIVTRLPDGLIEL
jgi:16S rRNA processing protein RimM